MSLKEVMAKLDHLEQQIQLILKDNVALYLQNQELKKQLENNPVEEQKGETK